MKHFVAFLISATFLLVAANAYAQDYIITLQNHHFTPETLILPAHQKVKLTVKNLQSAPAEFESEELDREKVVAANSSVVVLLGPLDAGKYAYVDDFHHDTKGTLLVK